MKQAAPSATPPSAAIASPVQAAPRAEAPGQGLVAMGNLHYTRPGRPQAPAAGGAAAAGAVIQRVRAMTDPEWQRFQQVNERMEHFGDVLSHSSSIPPRLPRAFFALYARVEAACDAMYDSRQVQDDRSIEALENQLGELEAMMAYAKRWAAIDRGEPLREAQRPPPDPRKDLHLKLTAMQAAQDRNARLGALHNYARNLAVLRSHPHAVYYVMGRSANGQGDTAFIVRVVSLLRNLGFAAIGVRAANDAFTGGNSFDASGFITPGTMAVRVMPGDFVIEGPLSDMSPREMQVAAASSTTTDAYESKFSAAGSVDGGSAAASGKTSSQAYRPPHHRMPAAAAAGGSGSSSTTYRAPHLRAATGGAAGGASSSPTAYRAPHLRSGGGATSSSTTRGGLSRGPARPASASSSSSSSSVSSPAVPPQSASAVPDTELSPLPGPQTYFDTTPVEADRSLIYNLRLYEYGTLVYRGGLAQPNPGDRRSVINYAGLDRHAFMGMGLGETGAFYNAAEMRSNAPLSEVLALHAATNHACAQLVRLRSRYPNAEIYLGYANQRDSVLSWVSGVVRLTGTAGVPRIVIGLYGENRNIEQQALGSAETIYVRGKKAAPPQAGSAAQAGAAAQVDPVTALPGSGGSCAVLIADGVPAPVMAALQREAVPFTLTTGNFSLSEAVENGHFPIYETLSFNPGVQSALQFQIASTVAALGLSATPFGEAAIALSSVSPVDVPRQVRMIEQLLRYPREIGILMAVIRAQTDIRENLIARLANLILQQPAGANAAAIRAASALASAGGGASAAAAAGGGAGASTSTTASTSAAASTSEPPSPPRV